MSVPRDPTVGMAARRIRRTLLVAGFAGVAGVALTACSSDGGRVQLRVASTTSLYDTGLLDELVPAFHAAHPEYEAQVVAVGTGEALALGRRGDADVVLAHAPEREERFLSEGHGLRRTTFMRNDYVIAGPAEDPAGVADAADPADALRRIARAEAGFASRGDDSGTNIRERTLWRAAGLEPGGDWYLDVGQGMGSTLLFAAERRAYALTDRATLTTLRANGLDLVEVYSDGDALLNVYSVIPASRALRPEGAAAFEAWILGDEAAAIIRDYGAERYGRPLFTLTGREPEPESRSGQATL